MPNPTRIAIALVLTFGMAAMAGAHSFSSHGLNVVHPWARATPPGIPVAVYFKVTSNGASDVLLGVATPVAGNAMMHQSADKNGQSSMVHVDSVEVAPGEPIVFQPGGYHVMLMQLEQPLEKGDRFPLTLHFKNAGDIHVEVVVQGMTATNSARHPHATQPQDSDKHNDNGMKHDTMSMEHHGMAHEHDHATTHD